MADNINVTPGVGATLLADDLTDADLGAGKVGYAKIMDGTPDSGNKLVVTSGGAVKADGSAVTHPVSVAALPLPAGAATAAKQPALGTAGTPASDVISVQGVASGTDLPVSVSEMPAAGRTTDTISAALATDKLMSSLTELTPKFAKIAVSSSGASTVVAAVTGKKIRVLSWSIVANAAVNAKWQSHTTPTDLTGLHYCAANGGISVPFSPVGHFETVAGQALDLNLSGAVAVGGSLVYVEV